MAYCKISTGQYAVKFGLNHKRAEQAAATLDMKLSNIELMKNSQDGFLE